jgi:hypothetical protein
MMTVSNLIGILENYGPDMEVRIAEQPNRPLEYHIQDAIDSIADDDDCDEDENEVGKKHGIKVVYIVEGRQIGYLVGKARNDVGWGR